MLMSTWTGIQFFKYSCLLRLKLLAVLSVCLRQSLREWPAAATSFVYLVSFDICMHPMKRTRCPRKKLDGRNAQYAGIRFIHRKLALSDGSAARKVIFPLKVEMLC
jgi:hypothetical protein